MVSRIAPLLLMTLQNISPDIQIMFAPRATLARMASAHPASRSWPWRRPLILALFIGATMSLIATRVLTARLVFSEALGWLFVPILQAMSLALVWWPHRRRLPFARALDLFFASNGPWLLWLLGLGAVTAFAPSLQAYKWPDSAALPMLSIAAVAALWSAYIDYCFFRLAFDHTPRRAAQTLVIQRAFVWVFCMLYAFWFPLLPLVQARFAS
jgi:hypothetical protein